MPKKPWEPIWDETLGDWRVSFSVKGRRIRRRLGIREKSRRALARREAERIWNEVWAEIQSPPEPSPGPLFFEAAAAYVADGGQARFLEPIMRVAGDAMPLTDANEAFIARVAEEVYPGRAPATIQRQVRGPVSAIVRHASGVRRRPSSDRARTRWLTPEEAEALLTSAAELTLPGCDVREPHTLAKIAAMLGTGWRTGECFSADVADWNPGSREWWTPAVERGAGKSQAAARWVVMPERVIPLLGDLPEVGRAFRTPKGQPIVMRENGGGQMAAAFTNARRAVGLGPEVTPHVLRHTWATWAYAQTRDLLWVQRRGGWSSVRMVERYAHLAPADLDARLRAHGWDLTEPVARLEPAFSSAPKLRSVT